MTRWAMRLALLWFLTQCTVRPIQQGLILKPQHFLQKLANIFRWMRTLAAFRKTHQANIVSPRATLQIFALGWVKRSLRDEVRFSSSIMQSLWSEEDHSSYLMVLVLDSTICCKGSNQPLNSDRTVAISECKSVDNKSILWQISFLTESSIVWRQVIFSVKLSVAHSFVEDLFALPEDTLPLKFPYPRWLWSETSPCLPLMINASVV